MELMTSLVIPCTQWRMSIVKIPGNDLGMEKARAKKNLVDEV